jgi:hypothetical protein
MGGHSKFLKTLNLTVNIDVNGTCGVFHDKAGNTSTKAQVAKAFSEQFMGRIDEEGKFVPLLNNGTISYADYVRTFNFTTQETNKLLKKCVDKGAPLEMYEYIVDDIVATLPKDGIVQSFRNLVDFCSEWGITIIFRTFGTDGDLMKNEFGGKLEGTWVHDINGNAYFVPGTTIQPIKLLAKDDLVKFYLNLGYHIMSKEKGFEWCNNQTGIVLVRDDYLWWKAQSCTPQGGKPSDGTIFFDDNAKSCIHGKGGIVANIIEAHRHPLYFINFLIEYILKH